ncbi:hypothetical protein GCM10009737_29460 [Nocardioides lentus]|uniref:Uncharacterized protein n=1 Tax=Nocardioides lentus TaxID=338077 RepID=A0ABN2PMG1_9ACTN
MSGSGTGAAAPGAGAVGAGAAGAGAAGAASPPTVDEIAAALAEDPVLVGPRFGNGDTAAVRQELGELVAAADLPTYVVMVDPPADLSGSDPAADLASRLFEASGDADATYLVHLGAESYTHEVVGFGEAPGRDELFARQPGAAFEGGATAGVTPAGVLARDLEVLLDDAGVDDDAWDAYASTAPWAETDVWEPAVPPPDASDAVFGPALLLVAVTGGVVVVTEAVRRLRVAAPPASTWLPSSTSGRRDRPDDLHDAASVRRRLDLELTAASEAVAAAAGTEGSPAPERRERRDGSLDTARRLADRLPADPEAEHLADLVGALVLTRTALREAQSTTGRGPRRRRREPSAPTPYACCTLDPRHGEATGTREVPVGDRTLDLPVCEACERRPASRLAVMQVPGDRWRRRQQPYLEQDTVWSRTGYGAFVDELWTHVADDLRSRREVGR